MIRISNESKDAGVAERRKMQKENHEISTKPSRVHLFDAPFDLAFWNKCCFWYAFSVCSAILC